MRNVVTGLMMLAGSVVREQGSGVDDMAWRREAQRSAPEAETQEQEAAVTVVAGPPIGTVNGIGDHGLADDAEMSLVAPGDWDVAWTRKRGNQLVFDRESVRELGNGTLFRWSAPRGTMPDAEDAIYTAVADCRSKSVEASWPGPRTQTRTGTCGRYLVDAVCSARP